MSKRKGYRAEIEVRDYFRSRGLDADRVVLSGAHYTQPNDVRVTAGFDGETVYGCEVKRRANGFKFQYDNLDGADFLIFRRDNDDWLVTLRLDTLADLIQ